MLNKDKPVQVIVDDNKCTKCGACVRHCPGEYLKLENNDIKAVSDSLFGCIQCGHCMMVCPTNAIYIEGEGISKDSLVALDENKIGFEELQNLLLSRRSCREFEDRFVENDAINKILEAASTAPISIPPTEVKVLVINGKDKVQSLTRDLITSFKRMRKFFNPMMIGIFKLFSGKDKMKVMEDFVLPLIDETLYEDAKGGDILFYDAPCVILFYKTNLAENEDALMASTLAVTAAETLGLGTCIIGSVAPSFNNSAKLKEKYGIAQNENVATALIVGYPKKTFKNGIIRHFKEVRHY